jgi:hypothetical protein
MGVLLASCWKPNRLNASLRLLHGGACRVKAQGHSFPLMANDALNDVRGNVGLLCFGDEPTAE